MWNKRLLVLALFDKTIESSSSAKSKKKKICLDNYTIEYMGQTKMKKNFFVIKLLSKINNKD